MKNCKLANGCKYQYEYIHATRDFYVLIENIRKIIDLSKSQI